MTEPLTPIAEPITGREDPGDLSRPEQALAQFDRGLNGRDLAILAENWEPSSDAGMGLFVELHDYTIHRSDSIFYAVGRERRRFERGSVGLDLAIRPTRIFRGVAGRWRQVHHHGSIEDPALLGAYRQAVSPAAR